MGTVYEAQDCVNQRRVALKVLSRPVTNDEARQRFLREGRLAASINHPNSVFVFGTHQIDALSMISMELVKGGTLECQLRRQGPLAPHEAIDITLQLIDGLVAAHDKGILHRDIKPSNCFLGEDGTVKIGDFGLSISSDPEFHDKLTAQGAMLGTPAFSSPEQLRGEALDVRSDIYALGSTLYYLLTGKTPFKADGVVQMIAKVLEGVVIAPHQLNRDIPADLSQIVMRCLNKEPGDRFRCYQELRAALLPMAASTVEPATPGLRALAEVIEWFALLLLGIALCLITGAPALSFFYSKFTLSAISASTTLLWISSYCLYYATMETIFGCSLGKWLLRLRVVDQSQNRPSFPAALLRAAVLLLLPTLPQFVYLVYVHFKAVQFHINEPVDMVQVAIGLTANISYWALMAILFAGARRQNGWLGIHEKISGTRVVQWCEPPAKDVSLAVDQEHRLAYEQAIGPYSIIGQNATTDGSSLLVGFDPVLLRRVWLRSENSNRSFTPYPEIARSTRLRWLNSVEHQHRRWEVFEYVEGRPLIEFVGDDTDWNIARKWLADLQYELYQAFQHDTLPQSLSLANFWLTANGRLKLLDFPAPILNDERIRETPTDRL
ncbi:MAG: protein kinase, partial [Pirellulaceae bacterium]|nr:protein kinase [Pirellulaceae bacterium]